MVSRLDWCALLSLGWGTQEEVGSLRQSEERTRAELELLRKQHGTLKESYGSLRMSQNQLSGDLEESRGDLAAARLDLSRLVASYQVPLDIFFAFVPFSNVLMAHVARYLSLPGPHPLSVNVRRGCAK